MLQYGTYQVWYWNTINNNGAVDETKESATKVTCRRYVPRTFVWVVFYIPKCVTSIQVAHGFSVFCVAFADTRWDLNTTLEAATTVVIPSALYFFFTVHGTLLPRTRYGLEGECCLTPMAQTPDPTIAQPLYRNGIRKKLTASGSRILTCDECISARRYLWRAEQEMFQNGRKKQRQ